MNKLHVLALTGLVFCGVSNASMMGQEQREVLYALHTLGQNFADVPMIAQNIDMFTGVLEMNIQINEAKLKAADQKIKDALWKNAALLGGIFLARTVSIAGFSAGALQGFDVKTATPNGFGIFCMTVGGLVNGGISNIFGAAKMFAVINMYDVWRNRSALIEALALDKEILSKLEEIKVSMDFIEDNTDSTENFLLNSAE